MCWKIIAGSSLQRQVFRRGAMSSHLGRVAVAANPSSTLVDEPVNISVRGLSPEQKITFAAVLEEEKYSFLSFAHLIADSNGVVNLSQMSSLGGSYKGNPISNSFPLKHFHKLIQL